MAHGLKKVIFMCSALVLALSIKEQDMFMCSALFRLMDKERDIFMCSALVSVHGLNEDVYSCERACFGSRIKERYIHGSWIKD